MDIKELVEPPAVELVPDLETKTWMRDMDIRVRRVEKLQWTLVGALPLLMFARACAGG